MSLVCVVWFHMCVMMSLARLSIADTEAVNGICVWLCLSVCLLTRVSDIIAAGHRDLSSCMQRPSDQP